MSEEIESPVLVDGGEVNPFPTTAQVWYSLLIVVLCFYSGHVTGGSDFKFLKFVAETQTRVRPKRHNMV